MIRITEEVGASKNFCWYFCWYLGKRNPTKSLIHGTRIDWFDSTWGRQDLFRKRLLSHLARICWLYRYRQHGRLLADMPAESSASQTGRRYQQ